LKKTFNKSCKHHGCIFFQTLEQILPLFKSLQNLPQDFNIAEKKKELGAAMISKSCKKPKEWRESEGSGEIAT